MLGACTDAGLDNAAFPWRTARAIEVAGVPLLALRLSFTGELARELHAPMARLGMLWDSLREAGERHGMVPFGSRAMDMLRLEKAYRGGHELAGDVSPVDAGLMRLVRLEKDFVGRDAVARRAAEGAGSTLAYLGIDAKDADATGGEPVCHAGAPVGSVSSGGFGAITGLSLAFAFLAPEAAAPGTPLIVSILGEPCPANVLAGPVRDPENACLRG